MKTAKHLGSCNSKRLKTELGRRLVQSPRPTSRSFQGRCGTLTSSRMRERVSGPISSLGVYLRSSQSAFPILSPPASSYWSPRD